MIDDRLRQEVGHVTRTQAQVARRATAVARWTVNTQAFEQVVLLVLKKKWPGQKAGMDSQVTLVS